MDKKRPTQTPFSRQLSSRFSPVRGARVAGGFKGNIKFKEPLKGNCRSDVREIVGRRLFIASIAAAVVTSIVLTLYKSAPLIYDNLKSNDDSLIKHVYDWPMNRTVREKSLRESLSLSVARHLHFRSETKEAHSTDLFLE